MCEFSSLHSVYMYKWSFPKGMYEAVLLASGASPPSELNGQFLYMFVMGTVHTIMLYVLLILRAHSCSPIMRSIQLV